MAHIEVNNEADFLVWVVRSGDLQGWDKTYCLQFVENDFDSIHFFGDKTYEVSCNSQGPRISSHCAGSKVQGAIISHID